MVFYTAPRSACRHRRWHCNAPLSPLVPFLCFQQLTTVAVCNPFILSSLQQWGGVAGEATFQFRFSGFQSISPLECAVPRFHHLSALECALTKTRSCNSFKMRSYGKRWGIGVDTLRPLPTSDAALKSGATKTLGTLDSAEDGLDVDDGGAVDGFDGADAQAVPGDFAHGDGMQAERIGPVRGAGGENAGQPPARVRARMNLSTLRRAWCSQVTTISSSPGFRPSRA